jgi:hypothetical protein
MYSQKNCGRWNHQGVDPRLHYSVVFWPIMDFVINFEVVPSNFFNCRSLASVIFETGSQIRRVEESAFRKSGFISIQIPASILLFSGNFDWFGRRICSPRGCLEKVDSVNSQSSIQIENLQYQTRQRHQSSEPPVPIENALSPRFRLWSDDRVAGYTGIYRDIPVFHGAYPFVRGYTGMSQDIRVYPGTNPC